MYDVKLCTMKCEDSKAIYVVIKVKMGHLLEGSYQDLQRQEVQILVSMKDGSILIVHLSSSGSGNCASD